MRVNINGEDYDQFILVENSLYPYIRLSRKRGNSQYPCGLSTVVTVGGSFSLLSDAGREERCPKIAWGFAATYLMNLRYDRNQEDYVELKDRKTVISEYYNKYLLIYMNNHNGLRYPGLSKAQKELNFLSEHEEVIRDMWEKCTPLKDYPVLFKYASMAESDYEVFLQKRNGELTNSSDNKVEDSSTVRRSITQNGDKSVYIENNTGTIVIGSDALNNQDTMKVHNEAYFAEIEQRIIKALDEANATIDVCVAWFTNDKLRDKLLEKSKAGIEVRVIIYKDGVNKSKGVDLTGLNHKEFRGERGGVEHHKFCVIDNVHTISGSYNWTLNAEHKNDEDTTFHFEDYKLASTFTRRFNEIWRRD